MNDAKIRCYSCGASNTHPSYAALAARLAEAERELARFKIPPEQMAEQVRLSQEIVAELIDDELKARLAEAELSRDSWKREAEMNAEFGDQLHTALAALKQHGIHVAEMWCWCGPVVTDYRHNKKGRSAASQPSAAPADYLDTPRCTHCGENKRYCDEAIAKFGDAGKCCPVCDHRVADNGEPSRG